MLSGVGGQGLVLMTNIICQAALIENYDVKSNDVVGLSQRGGMVWGNVKIGDKVYSPNIKPKDCDILLSMEPLEALRWSNILKQDGTVIMNTKRFYPVPVQQEKAEYPGEEIGRLSDSYKTIEVNAYDEALKIGKKQVSNVILLGVLARYLEKEGLSPIKVDAWKKSIAQNVPSKAVDMNMDAFDLGYNYL